MNHERYIPFERLPSGKEIRREVNRHGEIVKENHSYGSIDILLEYEFNNGAKTDETYIVNSRMVSRRTYEKARVAYPDMPPADNTIEDWSGMIAKAARKEGRQNSVRAKQRLEQSAESRFPRPDSTNWLRVISDDRSHLVVFASRDWKILANETGLPTGREWLREFGFEGSANRSNAGAMVLEIGFEVVGDRIAMLDASRRLMTELAQFVQRPPETSSWSGSIRPRPKPRKKPPLAWPTVLPPLIDFLEGLREPTVKIFNHYR